MLVFYAAGEWLHRETTRIGQTLAAEIQLGPYIGITVTDASQVGLALSSALTMAGDYAEADRLLTNRDLLDSWANYQWHQLARAFLMYTTQRWSDVLLAAAEELPPQAIVMSAVTASICALAAHAAAHLGQGRVALDWIETGGPKVARSKPERSGFGSRLIATSLKGDLGGAAELDYAADGFRARLTFRPAPQRATTAA